MNRTQIHKLGNERRVRSAVESAITLLLLSSGLFLAIPGSGCAANEGILQSGKETPAPAAEVPATDPVEKDIAAMRDVDFKWIYVIRRKDGGEIDRDDKAFIRENADMANRRVLSDNGKAVIIGSNYFLGSVQLKAIADRFDLTDLSPTGSNNGEPVKQEANER